MYTENIVQVLSTLSQMAVGQVADAAAANADAAKVQSIWDFILKGGPMMYPLALGSFVAITVIVERIISLRQRKIIPQEFLPGLNQQLENHPNDYSEALGYCQKDASPIANIFSAAIKRLNGPIEAVEKHIQEAGQREILKLRKNLRSLSVIAAIAPLMGLLGTIFGMILAFQTVATSSGSLGKAEVLAKGIYQAMITTAAGLMLAIPVLIAYHMFCAKIDRLVAVMDEITLDFVEQHAETNLIRESTKPKLQKIDAESILKKNEKKVKTASA